MKAVVREHIQQLDVSQGGGIVSDKIRVDTIDNPMLVIGLGGTGIDALLRLKYQINRRFKLPEDPITKKKRDKPDNVEFIAFETNEQDRHKKYKGIGLDPLTEFVLLSNAEIGSLLQNRRQLESYITDWLSPELLITDGISGASGIRQAGRLLLFTKILTVVQALEKKITGLSVGTNKKLMVFLLTGLSGGTGSGCFLDISYIVRAIIEREHGTAGVDKVNMLGYLFMPDVNLANNSLSDHTKEYIKKNGYAALKELDYWMNVDERGERFKQRYGNAITVNSPMPPFNLAHLISATNTEGKLLENSYDYCMNVTAENITNFMASEDKQSGDEFAIHDYISNTRTNINQMARPFAANYQYNILGASSAILPIEEMTTYLAFKLFKRMEKMFDSNPTQQDVDQLLRNLGMDKESIQREFEKRVPEPISGYQNSERFSYNNVVKTQVVSVDTELEQGYLARAREEYVKTKKQLPAQLMEAFTERINRMFLNPEQGPFFASRSIYTNKGYCLINSIRAEIESLREHISRVPDDIEAAKTVANERLGDARTAFISKERKKDTYIEAKIQEYLLYADRERMIQMVEFYEDLAELINEQNSRIYSVFTEVLNSLNSIFDNNGKILVNGDEQVDHRGNRTYYWNVVSVPDIVKTVSSIMDERDVNDLIRDFTRELLSKTDQWVKEQEIDIVSSVSDFLSEHFGALITRSMEEFLVMKYGNDSTVDSVIERVIAKKLDEEAIPVFHLSNSSGHFHFPSAGFVSIPADAPSIRKGIDRFKELALGNSKFTIKESQVKNRIFWLNTRNGIPLFAYTPMQLLEESYERTILEQEGIGRHLVQTNQRNWTYLPSPIPEKSWGDVYSNARIKGHNASIRQLFDKAVELGVIAEKAENVTTNSRFECIVAQPFDLQAFLAGFNFGADKDKPNFGEVRRCITELKAFLQNGLPRETVKDIFGSINRDIAKENLIRSPELQAIVRAEAAKYDGIQAKLAELEALVSQHSDEEKRIDLFIEVMYTGTIVKRGAQYVYDHDADEESWAPLVNLTKVNKFVEYVIFEQLRELDSRKRGLLERKSSRRSAALTGAADVSGLLAVLRNMAEAYQAGKEALDYDRGDFMNGEEMYSFYKRIAGKVNDMIKSLE